MYCYQYPIDPIGLLQYVVISFRYKICQAALLSELEYCLSCSFAVYRLKVATCRLSVCGQKGKIQDIKDRYVELR